MMKVAANQIDYHLVQARLREAENVAAGIEW
jgi:hypothetical protein